MQQNARIKTASVLTRSRRFVVVGLFVALCSAFVGVSVSPAQAANAAAVYFVQGLPGRTVDIAVNGKSVARDVEAKKIVGPISVTAGTPTVTIRDAGDGAVVVMKRVKLNAGANVDIVMHRPADTAGKPVLTWFTNDLSAVPAGKASLVVAHTAVVGPADVRVNGHVLFANIANGESLRLVVPAATYTVEIVPAGARGPVVLGPAKLPITAGTLTRVFAIGDPTAKSMTVVVQVFGAPTVKGSSAPRMVDTGTGGQAAALGLTVRR